MGVLTAKISDDLDKKLASFIRKTSVSKDKFVEEALEKYLDIKKFRELREETLKYAQKQGLYNDQDILNSTS